MGDNYAKITILLSLVFLLRIVAVLVFSGREKESGREFRDKASRIVPYGVGLLVALVVLILASMYSG